MEKKRSQLLEATRRNTKFIAGEGLKIPVFDMSLGNSKSKGRYQAEAEVLRNSVVLHSNDNQAFCSLDKLALYS
jgi:hypothetical protein